MHFLVLFGPPAVGKMAVGDEITRLTGLPLFHNHLSIEPVLRFFPFGSPPFRRLVDGFRRQLIDEVAGSELPGMVFTYVWDLDDPDDAAFLDEICQRFELVGANVWLVELQAPLEERILRNRTEKRLSEKPSKRDIARSESNLLHMDQQHRLNSGGEIPLGYRHLIIDNTLLTPTQVAEDIVRQIGLPGKQD